MPCTPPQTGVGPEIATAVKAIFSAAGVPVSWDTQVVSKDVDPRTNSMVTRENLDAVLVSRAAHRSRGRALLLPARMQAHTQP